MTRSAALFVLTDPQGDHGFAPPGRMIDDARAACVAACTESGEDPCGCSTVTTYDVGLFLVNMVGSYLASTGSAIRTDVCMADDSCSDFAPLPAARGPDQLP